MTKRRVARAVGVVGYIRVSTVEQADSGAGLDAQRTAIQQECQRRGMNLLAVYEDAGVSGRNLARPALTEALDALDGGRAAALIVAKVDRLSRSLADFASLMGRAQQQGWNLIALDLGVDTSTPAGELMASIVATTAQYERRLIGQRTKEALASRRALGVKLGRPRTVDPALEQRIVCERATGRTLVAIADGLNADGFLTPSGRPWSHSLVRKVAIRSSPSEDDVQLGN